jgi:tetratricopeptide (TPR) repeat protein
MGKASRRKSDREASERETSVAAVAPAAGARSGPRYTIAICAALIVLVLLVFGRTAWNGYIEFDDPDYVSRNAVVQRGLTAEGVKYAFTSLQPYYWQPLTWLSHELDCTLFGNRPGPQHLEGVLLHALTAALLFLFLQRATNRSWLAAIAAAIWAVHPMRVESVAWIAERKDILSGLFLVGALLAYAHGRRFLALSIFALALMSKPTVVTAPLLLILLNFWPFRRREGGWRRPLLEAAVPAALAIPVIIATVAGQQSAIAPISLWLRIATAFHNAGAYLGKFLLPIDLAVIYPFQEHPGGAAVIAAAVVVAITYAAWYFRDARPYLATGWGWYLVMLLPVSGLVQSGAQGMADRFTYIPSMGLAIAAVWLCGTGSQPVRGREAAALRAADGLRTRPTLAAVGILAFAALSFVYAGLWRDTLTLFTHAAKVTTDNSLAQLILGNALMKESRYDEANAAYAEAVRASHGGTLPSAAAGSALVQQRRYLEAVEHLQRAVDADPNMENVREDLAIALTRSGRAAAALPQLDAALKLAPSRALDITLIRAEAELALGRTDQALADFQQVAQKRPTGLAWNGVGSVYSSKNDFANAERAYREAIRLDPQNYDARMNLGAMLSREGRNDDALASIREAARIAPDSVEPRVYLALIEAQMGRHAEAANDASEALRIDPPRANDYFTNAVRIPPKDTNLADFIATMRAR